MARKYIACFIMAAFSLFNYSCFFPGPRPKTREPEGMVPAEIQKTNKSLSIISVITKDGKEVTFREGNPGRLLANRDFITGYALRYFEIGKEELASYLPAASGRPGKIVTRDKRVYQVVSYKEDADKIHFGAYVPTTIPLSDIQQVWVRKPDRNNTVLMVTMLAALAGMVLMATKSHHHQEMPEESCPFVYSFDGGEYVLDAEPYGTAISEILKRTDWVELPHLRATDGKYRLLLTNELDETQYTDELKLMAVDHAPGVEVAPDLEGRLHTFDWPQPPTRAADQDGRDILTFVRANDRVFWIGDLEGRHPDEAGDFRDELVFEFPKPAGVARAKLLANVWTTMWASISAAKFLELNGSSLEESYQDVDRGGQLYHLFQSWMDREELYRLKIWVETPGGWEERGAIWGGAPVVTQDKAYLLDVSDVPGEMLRIKLRPPVNFWMVNSLAVDYGEDLPVRVTELAAGRAVDHTGRDVRRELEASDGLYYVSPNPGERTVMEFAAPPVPEGLERTVLVKASGYYRAHLDAKGAPQLALIARVLGEPGFAARYSFRKYLEWQAAVLADAARR